jgi:hypothetical protein
MGGTYKGLIGECLFKLTRRYLVSTKFFNKDKYLTIFGKYLSDEQIIFLESNWHSIDSIEFDYSQKPVRPILFEVKTLNDFYYARLNGFNRIPKFTKSTYYLYKKALEIGFVVKVAIIWLRDNWEYDVEIIDFDKCKLFIEGPRKYDKGAVS